jgi:hypothetical protein
MPLQMGDIVRAVFFSRLFSQNGLIVHHYKVSSQLGLGAWEGDAADTLSSTVGVSVRAAMSSAASYLGCTVQVIAPLGADVVGSTDGTGVGGLDGDPLPLQTAGLISLRTGQAGRSFRGRKYIPFPSEGMSDLQAKPLAAYTNLLSAVLQELLMIRTIGAGANTSEITPIIWSRTRNTATPLSTGVVRGDWATQRRRSQVTKADIPVTP